MSLSGTRGGGKDKDETGKSDETRHLPRLSAPHQLS